MNQQCIGITRRGERCKINRNLIDGYCHLHRKGAAVTESASVMLPVGEAGLEIPPVNSEAPVPTDTPKKRNTALNIALSLCIMLLIFMGIKKYFRSGAGA